MRNAKRTISGLTFSAAIFLALSSQAADAQRTQSEERSAEKPEKVSPHDCQYQGQYNSEGECDYAGQEWVHYEGAANYRCTYWGTSDPPWLLFISYDYSC